MPILNLGCGVSENFPDATHCLDCSRGDKNRLKLFADRYFKRAQFMDWDMNNLPLPYDCAFFDKVYLQHVLEHFTKAAGERLVRDIHRILKPNGILYTEVPDLHWLACQIAANADLAEAPMGCGYPAYEFLYGGGPIEYLDCHKSGYTGITLSRLLSGCGFQVVEITRERKINLQITARMLP